MPNSAACLTILRGTGCPGPNDKGVDISDLISMVTEQLGAGGLGQIAGMLGTNEEGASSALSTALGALTGALARNSSEPKGAAALDAALEKDHDGSIFDNIGGFLGNVAAGPGAGILGHVLGRQEKAVSQEIGKQSGLDLSQATGLLQTVAPLLMGALGKKKREEGLDAGGLAGLLAGEKEKVQESASGGLSSLLGMIDAGSAMGFLAKAASMLGALFGGKKSG